MVRGRADRDADARAARAEVALARRLQAHVDRGVHRARALGLEVDAPVVAARDRQVRGERADERVELARGEKMRGEERAAARASAGGVTA